MNKADVEMMTWVPHSCWRQSVGGVRYTTLFKAQALIAKRVLLLPRALQSILLHLYMAFLVVSHKFDKSLPATRLLRGK